MNQTKDNSYVPPKTKRIDFFKTRNQLIFLSLNHDLYICLEK